MVFSDDHSAREGLFDTISRSKTHYQKRAYQCIKLLVNLFGQCPAAKHLLDTNVDIKRKWSWSVEWLSDELDRGRGGQVRQRDLLRLRQKEDEVGDDGDEVIRTPCNCEIYSVIHHLGRKVKYLFKTLLLTGWITL